MSAARMRALLLLTAALVVQARVHAQTPDATTTPAPEAPAPPEAAPTPESTAARAAAAPPATDYTLSASELAELGLTTEEGEVAPLDTAIKLYGYVDFGISAMLPKEWRRAVQPHSTFYIGNFNVYLSKQITSTVRMFSEVRFTYLPNGYTPPGSTMVTSTLVGDYTDFGKQMRWGGIDIQRVYLEWAMTPWLTLRVGQFLTPYGIWNVDHGSPTIIPVVAPYAIGRELFPSRQTGLELRGRVQVSSQYAVGYHLTLSNGIGPISDYKDLDNNKAVGGRAYLAYEGFGRLTVGASGFVGTNADAVQTVSLEGQKVKYGEQINSKANVVALAGDVQWTYGGFLLQAEFIARQLAYTEDGRPVLTHPFTGMRMALQDTLDRGGYVLTGYRFDWLGVMPYFSFNYINYIEPEVQARPKAYVFDFGLNIRPIDAVVVKLQYQYAYFDGGFVISNDPDQILFFQLAWAF